MGSSPIEDSLGWRNNKVVGCSVGIFGEQMGLFSDIFPRRRLKFRVLTSFLRSIIYGLTIAIQVRSALILVLTVEYFNGP